MNPRALATLLLTAALCAARAIAFAAEPPPKITANIRTLANTAQPLSLYWLNKEAPQEITVYPRELSRKNVYHGVPSIAFYPKGPDGAPPVPGAAPIAQCVLPPKNGDYLLVFTPATSGSGYRVLVIPEDIRGFKEGMFLFLNFSSRQIHGAIDSLRFSVASGQTALMAFPSRADAETGLLLKIASVDENEQWKLVYQRPQFYRAGCRWWAFLFDTPQTPEGIDVRIFRDKLPLPPGQTVAPHAPPPPPDQIFNGPQNNPPPAH